MATNLDDDAGTGESASMARVPVKQASKLSPEALYNKIKQWFLADSAHSEDWRGQAGKDFDFVAGDQWDDDTYKRMVKDEKRQPITFNKTQSFIKMVAGLEINGRTEIVYLPRGTEEGAIVKNELLGQASRWMADQCDAEDSESQAFRDMATCGMGWTESRIDFELDPDGTYVEDWIDPLEMYWDKSARMKNLADATRVYRVRKMRLEDARALADTFEGGEEIDDTFLDASWAIGVDQKAVKPYEEIRLKTGAGNANAEGVNLDPNQEVHIVQVQWIERETYYRVALPEQGEEVYELDEASFKQIFSLAKAQGKELTFTKQVRKAYKQAFVGGCVFGVSDCPAPDRFTFQCMTGERHRAKGTWFGLVKLMRDPQMWTNKLFSQVIHILNTTAKGGILAEKDAFPDIREALKTYARPDAITIVEEGAISKGKIMQKPGVGLAAPFVQMMDYANRAFYDVTAINLELMGMRGTDQPGILEAQRKQAGMTILATLFDARRNYMKQVGRIRLHFIQNFLSDGRLMRIIGPEGFQAIRLIRDKVQGKYDIEVADAPTSPDQKSATWSMLMQLMPYFQATGSMTPEIAGIFLDYSPLPSKVSHDLKQALQKPPQGAAEAQAMGQAREQAQLAVTQAKASELQAKAEKDRAIAFGQRAETAKDYASAILDIAQAQHLSARDRMLAIEQMLGQISQTSVVAQPRNILPDAPFAVEPMGRGVHGLPELPTLPTFGADGRLPQSAPPAMMDIESLLRSAGSRPAQPNQPII